MTKTFYQHIIEAKAEGRKLLAVLLDPEKISLDKVQGLSKKINISGATHILIGGSTVPERKTDILITQLRPLTNLPIFLFPGDYTQLSPKADALLFLSLISGRNPEYLIGQHVKAVPFLKESNLEIIPTSYILIDGGNSTSVARVSQTQPLSITDPQFISDTAQAGEWLGHKLIYLEAGSGAQKTVPTDVIQAVSQVVTQPIIVGGGIRSLEQLQTIYTAGADMIVIGTAFEENLDFFEELQLLK